VIKATDVPETDGYRAPTSEFIDGITYDAHKPNDYLRSFPIGRRD